MSYINAIKRNNDVLVWKRENGKRVLAMHDAPYYFYTKDPAGEYTSMFGDKLTRHDFNTGKEFNDGRSRMSAFGAELYESDVPIELKVLSEKYYEAELPKLHVTLFDIEVDYDPAIGYSSLENPYAPVNSVAYYHNWKNEMVVHAVPPPGYDGVADQASILKELDLIADIPKDVDIRIELFENEHQLLKAFLEEIEDSDVLSGWNSEGYDIPMIGKRIEMMGSNWFNKLSFPEGNTPKWKEEEIYNKKVITLNLSGRVSLDYMLIFKKFEVVMRPSYRLEAISDEILVDKEGNPTLPKLEYDKSLAYMYKENFMWFLRYNLRDTEILKGFEDTLGYVELSNAFIHLSTGLFKHVTGTLKLSELSTINYCHYDLDGVICPDIHPPDQISKAKGAFVLMPQKGEHEMIGSVDINSLYPSAIRSNNISPETIIGQFQEEIRAAEEIKKRSYVNLTLEMDTGEILSATAEEWHEALLAKGWGISGFGTVFNQDVKGIMPSILEQWYSQRKVYQAKQVEAQKNGDKAAALYYKKLQFVYKIKLNSYYGSLLNPYFRFYDKRMGESTTATSRIILLHQCAKVTELLDGKYILPDREVTETKAGVTSTHIGYSKDWSVIYGDTDSTYFVTHGRNVEEATLVADTIGEVITESFPEFMRETFLCKPGFDDIIKTGREIVSDKGIFVDKKRYFLHLVNDDGFECDKIKVMGLDTKKTALPKYVSSKLNSFVERYLKGATWEDIAEDVVDFKTELEEGDIIPLGITMGVQNVEMYTEEEKTNENARVPGHVRASILYNQCLEKYNDVDNQPIISGAKIKKYMLLNPEGKWKTMAFPADIEVLPAWFEENFKLDYAAQIERLVDKPLDNIIKAIGKETPSKQSLLTDSLLDF
jgi:DNA polymerase elongation subunit (family B)